MITNYIIVDVEALTGNITIVCGCSKQDGDRLVKQCNQYHDQEKYLFFQCRDDELFDTYCDKVDTWRENHPLVKYDLEPPFNNYDSYKLIAVETI